VTQTEVQDIAASRLGEIEVPWNLVVPEVDIHVVGYGNRFPNDFTLEMLAVLQRCKRVFGAPPLRAPEFGIPPMESLMPLYAPDKRRIKTYSEMMDTVLAAALADPPVAFATYGSAMVGVHVAHRLVAEARDHGLTTHVTSAVSSFDSIWADMNIEPFYGFEVWEASTFARLGIEPNTEANLLLPQAPLFDVLEGIDPEAMTIATSTAIADLRDHLLRFYPPDHLVHYIKAGAGTGPYLVGADIESIPLRDLDHPGHDPLSTLYIPRAGTKGRGRLDYGSPALQQARS
jgi:uncharacterized protein YabN with tetrapyrrole methylase and pyrophosphatase domain